MNVNLHIERLVLDGVASGKREGGLIEAAVQTELARLLAQSGLTAASRAEPVLRAPAPVGMTVPAQPEQLGRQIAQTIYGGLRR